MTDWMEKANAQKDDYLKDLTTLVKIPSVRDDSQATADAPLGPGPAKALPKQRVCAQSGSSPANRGQIYGLDNL